jgi:hypothetical protein
MKDEGGGMKEIAEGAAEDFHPSSIRLHRSPLARQLGLFGTTMAVIGGIIGAGIFINPYIVAQRVHTAPLILGTWIAGGLIALAGGFIYAELAAGLPVVGGQYAYLREALHPAVAFVYGWVLLLVIQTGGMAAVAVTFARYFVELTQWPLPDSLVAAGALAFLTAINCLGVRAGSRLQAALTLGAIAAIALLEAASFWRGDSSRIAWQPILDQPKSIHLAIAFGAAMTPVIFAYGGWQTSSFLGGEVREPRRNLPRGLILGVLGVIAVYVSINFVYLRELGASGLAVLGHARFVRRGRRKTDRGRHRHLGFWISRPINADRAAGLFCDGGGWRFLSRRRVGGSAHPSAGGGDHPARSVGNRDRTRRNLCPGGELRRGDGLHFLWPNRGLSLRSAAAGERAGKFPRAGPSGDNAAFHRRPVDDRGQHYRARSETSLHRVGHRARWFADLFSLATRG